MAGDGTWLVGVSDGVESSTPRAGRSGRVELAVRPLPVTSMATAGCTSPWMSTWLDADRRHRRGTASSLDAAGQWTPGMFTNAVVGDFNGDHRADIAGLASDGTWWVDLASSSGFVNTQWGAWDVSHQYTSIQVGDFNGDRVSDIAGLGCDGTWMVSGIATAARLPVTDAANAVGRHVQQRRPRRLQRLPPCRCRGPRWSRDLAAGNLAPAGGGFDEQPDRGRAGVPHWQGSAAGNFLGARKDQILGFRSTGRLVGRVRPPAPPSTRRFAPPGRKPRPRSRGSPREGRADGDLAVGADLRRRGDDQLFGSRRARCGGVSPRIARSSPTPAGRPWRPGQATLTATSTAPDRGRRLRLRRQRTS